MTTQTATPQPAPSTDPRAFKRFADFYPFYLSRRHAALGARLAARHGASRDVVRLIAGHHGRGDDPALKLLQSADEES